jgi:hypothetical protein
MRTGRAEKTTRIMVFTEPHGIHRTGAQVRRDLKFQKSHMPAIVADVPGQAPSRALFVKDIIPSLKGSSRSCVPGAMMFAESNERDAEQP